MRSQKLTVKFLEDNASLLGVFKKRKGYSIKKTARQFNKIKKSAK